MPRHLKIGVVVLVVAVVVGLIYSRVLHQRVARLARTQATEEQERREVVAPPISTPTDVVANAQVFWLSSTQPDRLASVTVQLPLSADPVERAKQLIGALITNPPTSAQRTLPVGATLLSFYILPDGTAVADFSDALASEMPSGILSEWMAVNSIVQTLAANMPGITRLKILIHGQEAETLAGHIDISGFFDLHSLPATAPGTATPATTAPAQQPKPGAPAG
ncbi:MAG TPA: GerMN domain-containing protein [Candidatus Acidoferrales bacterium]|nr:GerMN domain-containing protein [Candidatus Acidoferrales bacterium]